MDLNHKNIYLSWALVQIYTFNREITPICAHIWRHISYSEEVKLSKNPTQMKIVSVLLMQVVQKSRKLLKIKNLTYYVVCI